MINVMIDCPFSQGDEVYVVKEKAIYNEIDCPFCHGKKWYETGMDYLQVPYGKMGNHSADKKMMPWVVKCETCNNFGKVISLKGYEEIKEKGIVLGINNFHSSGWTSHEYEVGFPQEDGTVISKNVYGYAIRLAEKEGAM